MLKVRGIDRALMRMVNEAARDSLPNEFAAMLREEDGVVQELVLLPGTLQGKDSATLMLHMMPIDYSIVGTVHSHPGYSNRPSRQDLELFRRSGYVHVITCMPFDEGSWRAYDGAGRPLRLPVVDL
ncbi:MAG TPA: Mov34/MPN/PAD-1 family protein [Methanomassiliicoccales archaeon]|nr:Mov34/MPN/PAD-1 family protein [Methanomassiliicoccales archaeon]HQM67581.1 Mov34/MPN/PAD-1 family protein [Methanomassiliicoccales archaeon]